MALRRKLQLPSRMAPDAAPEAAAAPEKSSGRKPAEVLPAVEVTSVVSAPQEVTAPDMSAGAMAEAAMAAFGDLPQPVTTPRILEESFQASAVPADIMTPSESESFTAPAWQAPDEPVAEAAPSDFTAPAWESPVAPVAEQPVQEFAAPAWELPQADVSPVAEEVMPVVSQPDIVAVGDAAAVEGDVAKRSEEMSAAPETQEIAAQQPATAMPVAGEVSLPEEPVVPVFAAPEELPQAVGLEAADTVVETDQQITEAENQDSTPQGPVDFSLEASRPGGNRIKRRVREKRARDFSAMGAPEGDKPRNQPAAMAFAPNVPVDDKPLDQVDSALVSTGVIAPPPGDSLTSRLPTGLAEMTSLPDLPPVPEPQAAPADNPSVSQSEAEPADMRGPQPETYQPVSVEPAGLSGAAEAGAEAAANASVSPAETAETQPFGHPVETPSFTLSNAKTDEPAVPQSNLPWAQPPQAAEWDIGTPPAAADSWQHAAPEAASEPAMHMPPQADLYKPMTKGGASVPPMLPGGIPSVSPSMAFTPELPGQRRKAQGTPWALVVVGLLVVAAAGAYLMTGGSSSGGAQLAKLTNRSATGNQQDPLLPPPDAASTGTSSFMPALPEGGDTSSSAVVDFADVSPDQAKEPIVADGNEEIPQGFIAQFQDEVEKARARKAGEAPLTEGVPVAAAAGTDAAGKPTYTQEDLNKELEAYRNALSSSANPSELKPANFDAGKTAGKTDAELASGALLPPPSSAVPPTELYANNPANLPIVSEPVVNAPDRVRTLADFPDMEAYMPEREKVEIPANVRPKLAATDFPALEVLSFVPGQGIVAFADGREGVLLIGESLNGWELVAVNGDSAQFKAGQKSYEVTAN